MDTELGTSPTKRRNMDIMKLMMSDYKVESLEDDGSSFDVIFHGPKDTAYAGGVWKVHVDLPIEYPYRSPSIGFRSCLYHPNVDESSGSVCLDVINQTWSPMFDLVNIFDVFLPQLLAYPNPKDPLNNDAASMLLKDPEKYKTTVKNYVDRFSRGKEDTDEDKTTKSANDSSGSTNQGSSCSTVMTDESDDDLSSLSDASEGGFDLDI